MKRNTEFGDLIGNIKISILEEDNNL